MTAPMRIRNAWVAVGLMLVAAACASRTPSTSKATATAKDTPAAAGALPKELVVGTSGGFPPFVIRRAGTISGLELDFAEAVGKTLGIPVRLTDVPWDQLFGLLADRKVDVVMAGVTVTKEREAQFAFADPYLRTNIVALVRTQDKARLGSRDAACKSGVQVGVIAETTGERYVRDECPTAKVRPFATGDDAVLELVNGRLDAVVGDGPVLAYLMDQQATALEIVPTGNMNEALAWMVRRDDTALLQALNGALATMKQDGTLDRLLKKWIPQVDRIRAAG
jgi:ABC-type amino acid transport substrate-binding protein